MILEQLVYHYVCAMRMYLFRTSVVYKDIGILPHGRKPLFHDEIAEQLRLHLLEYSIPGRGSVVG